MTGRRPTENPFLHTANGVTGTGPKELQDREAGKSLRGSRWTGYADFCNPFEFANIMRTAESLKFEVMLESKAKDLALIHLRPEMLRTTHVQGSH